MSVKIHDGELFSYQLSTGCTKEMQNRTRSCLQPLMITWRNIRERRPLLKNYDKLLMCYHLCSVASLDGVIICRMHEYDNFIANNTSFPIYKYKREELLELCDGYANLFMCAGSESITICLNDEMVRFARDHFGYICTPQNIKRFMKHHVCISMALADTNSEKCQMFIGGVAEPGNDQNKCRGVRQYYDCIKWEIMQKCGNETLKEIEASINEYGCNLRT
ncbi:unnamed protein product [Litomosoides sigmodontis]|uniref:DUF19 domain-containing protein n=1 Tax=Litomosoides sigmodontis TaxID=42156 RepID=A0A3P6V4Z6_LITSI|nr:unnamed protein product [Litomosoides sigmodontis]